MGGCSLPSPVFGSYVTGGNTSLPSPLFGFVQQGGATLCRPLCSVLYCRWDRREERISIVPCVRFFRAKEGGGSLPSPVFGFIQKGGTVLYRSLCSVEYDRRGTALYRPLVQFYIGVSMAFRGGDGVRSPPRPCQEGRSWIIRRVVLKNNFSAPTRRVQQLSFFPCRQASYCSVRTHAWRFASPLLRQKKGPLGGSQFPGVGLNLVVTRLNHYRPPGAPAIHNKVHVGVPMKPSFLLRRHIYMYI